jgi:hypothetical protein
MDLIQFTKTTRDFNIRISKNFDIQLSHLNLKTDKGSKSTWFKVYKSIFEQAKPNSICYLINMYIRKKTRTVKDEIKQYCKKFHQNEEDVYLNVILY